MSFKDIKGQEQAIYALQQDLNQGRLASSYLFLGPQGIGKKKTALTLAKALNCQEAGFDSCDSCRSCLKIGIQNHPDIHFIGQADTDYIKIEAIRQLKKQIGLKAYEGRRKVFIIDNAHQLTAESSNALLKILEEPIGGACIILISSKFNLLFKTVVSRCRVIRFYPLARAALVEILRKDYSLDDALAHFLAYFCEGRLGSSVELKDADVLNEKNRVIDNFALRIGQDMPRVGAGQRELFRKHLNILASWFRDVYMVKVGLPQAGLIHLDRAPDLLKAARRYSFGDLEAIINFIADSLRYLEENINPKLLLSNLRMELSKT